MRLEKWLLERSQSRSTGGQLWWLQRGMRNSHRALRQSMDIFFNDFGFDCLGGSPWGMN